LIGGAFPRFGKSPAKEDCLIYISAVDRNAKTREIEIVYNFIGAFDFGAATEQVQNQSRQAKIGIA
jgi:hypothetical protein